MSVSCKLPAMAPTTFASQLSTDVSRAVQQLQTQYQENRKTVMTVAGVSTAVLGAAWLYRRAKRAYVPKRGPYPPETLPAEAFDAVIVGAGPSGSVCAYYLSKTGAKVAVLEKETFPRDKVSIDQRVIADMEPLQHAMMLQKVMLQCIAPGLPPFRNEHRAGRLAVNPSYRSAGHQLICGANSSK